MLAIATAPTTTAAQSAAELPLESYQSFEATTKTNCDMSSPYAGWEDTNPLRNKSNPYPEITDEKLRDRYEQYMAKIHADPSCFSETPTGIPALDLAKCVYRETQNTLFACYAIETQLKIATEIRDQFTGNGRAKEVLDAKVETLKKMQMGDGTNESVCATVNVEGPELKKALLKNSSVHMCRYVYYLGYLHANATNNSKAFITENTPQGAQYSVGNTEDASRVLGGIAGTIQNEGARVRQVQRTAIEAFVGMDRTYGMHLMLTVIYEDFVEIRDRLKALLNPMGQFVYKASNAQSPYNR
ncbi:MAG TPA: hypothetical protein PK765_02485 [bacterium]|nr:hypothetical protein [bacterium]